MESDPRSDSLTDGRHRERAQHEHAWKLGIAGDVNRVIAGEIEHIRTTG